MKGVKTRAELIFGEGQVFDGVVALRLLFSLALLSLAFRLPASLIGQAWLPVAVIRWCSLGVASAAWRPWWSGRFVRSAVRRCMREQKSRS
ncbi:MAG: hypothetical protein H0T92_03555 [Pyrinomonadaceae bacterium]|nr:hypothetical protein [Pyrinomonadaceae bacterium]